MIKRSLTIYIIRQDPCQTYACTCGYVHLPRAKNCHLGTFVRDLTSTLEIFSAIYHPRTVQVGQVAPPRNSGFGGTYRNFTAKDSKYVGTFIILEHVAQVYGVVWSL